MRPIINLKPLNKFIRAPHFTMTTVKDVFQIMQRGDCGLPRHGRHIFSHKYSKQSPSFLPLHMERTDLPLHRPPPACSHV